MFYLSDFCHICLQDDKNLIDLSEKRPENNLIATKLAACVSEVKWSTIKRLHVCNPCLQKLEWVFDFKQTCIKSHDIFKKRLAQLKGRGKRKSLRAKLHVSLPREPITAESITEYHNSQTNSDKYGILCQILDRQQPLTLQPMTSFITTDGVPISYQNIFLNFVSTNPTVPIGTMNQPLLMNTALQNDTSGNDKTLKELLESKKSEELSIEIDPALYNFGGEHFLASPHIIRTSNIECKACGTAFITNKLLQKHFDDVHSGILPYSCRQCPSTFLLEDHYDKHMKTHAAIDNDSLSQNTINLENLSKMAPGQIQGNIITTDWVCEICCEGFNSAEHLKKHDCNIYDSLVKNGTFRKGRKSAQCPLCKSWFSTKSYLKQHLKSHYIENNPVNQNSVREKIDTVIIEEDSDCDDVEIISDDENYESSNKGRSTENNNIRVNNKPNDLKIHKNQIMMRDTDYFSEFVVTLLDGKFACTFCRSEFGMKQNVLRHIHQMHLSKTSYHCHLCGDKFSKIFKLTSHLRLHFLSLSCSECKEIFMCISTATTHMKIVHQGLKRIDCKVCGVSFAGNEIQHLTAHVSDHQLDISYKCHMCEVTVKECRDFIKHLLGHNGMISCQNCDQVFNKVQYPDHKGKCEPGKFKCSICSRTYQIKRHLDTHLVVVHSREICTNEPQKKKHKIDNDN